MDRPSPEQAEFFAAQYERIYKKLYLTALSILRNPSLAEDALQEAALKSYEKYSSLREPAFFSTWMSWSSTTNAASFRRNCISAS